MDKIKFVTDTASDIPDDLVQAYGIDMPSIPIAVDGEEYFERTSFSIQEFYRVLGDAKEIPVTSRVPMDSYITSYHNAWKDGCTHLFNVTLNAGGSGINASAQMARDLFFEQNPEAKGAIDIRVVDSRTYSMVYGHPVVEGAKMASEGAGAQQVQDYLDDWFDSAEIYLGCYTLEYAKKSGRIGAAAAFVGDVLGLRPVISMIDGDTKTTDKVRGDKNLTGRIFKAYQQSRASKDDPVFIVRGELDEPAQELQAMLREDLGREVPVYYCGASIAINAGPKMIAIVCKGRRRPQ